MTIGSVHGLTTPRAAVWSDAGACVGEDPELFHPDGTVGRWVQVIAEAKAICNRCPVREQCLEWAIDTRQDYGIFGGLDEYERQQRRRRQVRNARRAAETPRNPKPAAPATLRELLERNTSNTDGGHRIWTGGRTPVFRGRYLTPNQLAYLVDRGHEWNGAIHRMCQVEECVAHLADTAERRQAAKAAV